MPNYGVDVAVQVNSSSNLLPASSQSSNNLESNKEGTYKNPVGSSSHLDEKNSANNKDDK